jgi:thymidylate kinase
MQGYVDLPPEKWLARIEDLRKQGRIEEAKAGFTAFRKRYPEYPLPASLKDWAYP